MRLNDVDRDRASRNGVPEVVLASGKSDPALVEAIDSLLESHPVLVTRATPAQIKLIKREFGSKLSRLGVLSGTLVVGTGPSENPRGHKVTVVSGGSSDLSVAEEACISAEYLGLEATEIRDCGIAGLHRAQKAADRIRADGAGVVIVVAGMEGALPSVIASLVRQPVIAVPTSVGYGTGAGGLAALMAMLNSCVPGVVVVNIDNGFGAAAAARKMLANSQFVD